MRYISAFKQNKKDEKYIETILTHFNYFYLTDPGFYYPSDKKLEKYVLGAEYLHKKNKKIIGHCLFPSGLLINQSPYFKQLSVLTQAQKEYKVEEYLHSILDRTSEYINDWYVFNECGNRRTLCKNVYGDDYVDKIINLIYKINPNLKLRANEYGFQNPELVKSLINICSDDRLNIGLQVYCENPLFHIKLERALKQIREAYPYRDLFLSEICVLNNKLFSKSMYHKILELAYKYSVKEIGFWWPTSKYSGDCWASKPVGLWNDDMFKTKNYGVFFK